MSHLAAHIIAIWKSKGPTSHDVVDAVRRITGERRVGHAGTLDPMAEGVLVVGIGREATKRLSTEVAKEKEYRATIRLGATSTTDDAEGEIQAHDLAKFQNPKSKCQTNPKIQNPNRDNIERTLRQFVGQIQQVPPAYSAVKLKGTPAYKLARQGHVVDLKPRTVEMKEIELLEYTPPLAPPLQEGEKPGAILKLRVVCGPGTYIRALARDIGERLGVGGYLTALTRTRVGSHTQATAMTIEQFRAQWPKIAATP